MSEQEHAQALRIAGRTDRELARLFAGLGSARHPRGRVLTAYRQARRALAGNATDLRVVEQVLAELRRSLAATALQSLQTAGQAGMVQARAMARVYDLPLPVEVYAPVSEQAAWLALFDAQAAQVRALALTGEEAAILGDEGRVGALSPGPVVREGARWLAIAALAGLSFGIDGAISRSGRQDAFVRQAVAAIDERTTDCCLKVHGQAVGMRERFRLTGTPRFADRMRDPPFHFYCRTVWTLVRLQDVEDSLTLRMRDAATAELTARAETGRRVEIHPASATSRR
ncbi:MAG: phage head morphogenesis protein [Candidatus Promineofilum sp.]|uniref:hypothetical protein n=1 Tax=Promineifilum sp. TaxID=2664178 RepID=UPI002411D79D|nr:phage head morphogenesis protein [Promineifilum sp.]